MIRESVLTVALAGLALAGNWVTGGGNPWRSGLTDENGPARREDIAWQGTISGMFGLPVFIWEDKLVTTRFQSIDYAPIVCHDLATGETLWTRDFPGANSRSLPIGFRDGRVYAINFQESQHDTLYALDASDGHILWRGQITTWMSITESASFADNGDVLVSAADFKIARVNAATGDTVWTTSRVWPVSSSADVCVRDTTVYAYSGDIGSLFINAWDLATGRFKYRTRIEDTHPGGPLPQTAPMVGDDGTVYAHKPGDNVTALEDTGDSLRVLWTHEVSGDAYHYSIFSHFAVGPDRSVYCGSNGRIQRLDPATGVCTDSSPFIQDPTSIYFGLRMAIGPDGTVYVTTGTQNAALYSFTPDLQLNWADTIPNLNTSGPALAQGVLAVAGAGTTLKAYRCQTGVAEAGTRPAGLFSLRAQAVSGRVRLKFTLPAAGEVLLRAYDAAGRRITSEQAYRAAGEQTLELPVRGSGIGFASVTAGGRTATAKFAFVR
jgi:outer membrane protein assembly factor BamB